MAWLESHDSFTPEHVGQPVVGIAAQLYDHHSDAHTHEMGQILFSPNRSMSVFLEHSNHVQLAPKYMLWIPPHVKHQVFIQDKIEYRSIYLDPQHYQQLPSTLNICAVSPLLKETLEQVAISAFDLDWTQGLHRHILEICLHALRYSGYKPCILQVPQDRRVHCIRYMELPPRLKELAQVCGACEKTISRIFRHETGLNYQEWRQQWRLGTAQALLMEHKVHVDIAAELDFASPSAFITFFKKRMGCTPRVYAKRNLHQ